MEGIHVFEILEGNEKRYQITNEQDILVNWIDVISRIYKKVGLKLISKLHIEITLIRSIQLLIFNNEITELIEEKKL